MLSRVPPYHSVEKFDLLGALEDAESMVEGLEDQFDGETLTRLGQTIEPLRIELGHVCRCVGNCILPDKWDRERDIPLFVQRVFKVFDRVRVLESSHRSEVNASIFSLISSNYNFFLERIFPSAESKY